MVRYWVLDLLIFSSPSFTSSPPPPSLPPPLSPPSLPPLPPPPRPPLPSSPLSPPPPPPRTGRTLAEKGPEVGLVLRFNSSFPPRLREFVILLTGRFWDCQFEWFSHEVRSAQGGPERADDRDAAPRRQHVPGTG